MYIDEDKDKHVSIYSDNITHKDGKSFTLKTLSQFEHISKIPKANTFFLRYGHASDLCSHNSIIVLLPILVSS